MFILRFDEITTFNNRDDFEDVSAAISNIHHEEQVDHLNGSNSDHADFHDVTEYMINNLLGSEPIYTHLAHRNPIVITPYIITDNHTPNNEFLAWWEENIEVIKNALRAADYYATQRFNSDDNFSTITVRVV